MSHLVLDRPWVCEGQHWCLLLAHCHLLAGYGETVKSSPVRLRFHLSVSCNLESSLIDSAPSSFISSKLFSSLGLSKIPVAKHSPSPRANRSAPALILGPFWRLIFNGWDISSNLPQKSLTCFFSSFFFHWARWSKEDMDIPKTL